MSARRSHLRLMALSVEEASPGRFVWCLRESLGDAVVFETFQRAPATFTSYSAALADGAAHWQRLVAADGDYGPRSSTEDENADPVGTRVTTGPLMPPGKLAKHKLAYESGCKSSESGKRPENDSEPQGRA